MPVVISFAARKGGVGRTTTTVNLAGAWAAAGSKNDPADGARVLCIDLDGQASLSRAFLGSNEVESLRPAETVAALFQGDTPDVIQVAEYPNIHVLPAGDALEPLVTSVRRDFARDQHIIRQFIKSVAPNFDLVLIDLPPHTQTSSVWAALVASNFVLSPVPADAFGVQSISSVINLVAAIQAGPNPNLQILGYLLSMVQKNAVNNAYCKTLRQLHGNQVLDTEVPLMAAYKEAIARRGPVTAIKPRVKASNIVRELAAELEGRIETIEKRSAAA